MAETKPKLKKTQAMRITDLEKQVGFLNNERKLMWSIITSMCDHKFTYIKDESGKTVKYGKKCDKCTMAFLIKEGEYNEHM
jgi:hypothetical protein